jgi:hypothetical protein
MKQQRATELWENITNASWFVNEKNPQVLVRFAINQVMPRLS